ncbi:nicotinic acid mononucleotide adenyltransferase [Ulvibacter antarcticus]|uniref:Nicotinic acid mononucleotide adenyltransferase n=1 Tax=Ulvibacter antarcticus TaxID=442714 RepID=A0A3L9YZY8_9FLAO|nr:nicotinic acid mononucleotide adenyltransferase [Ulvibacter antarcticus]RMA66143.1 hypothetical protein BXY75_0562 [Ulvibacter antarcticus]
MKTLKLIFSFAVLATLFTSCYQEVIVEEQHSDPVPVITLEEVLSNYELWYVDIEQTTGNGSIPFMQIAFTMSFRNGNVFANNNLVGIGEQGNGFGIRTGYYDTYGFDLDISDDIDGFYSFEVTRLSNNEIELYNRSTNVSYLLVGYQRATFDYDKVFYDNIHYFLQEYSAWEKTFTSEYGAINEFDNENFVQFLPGGGDGNFQSSQDNIGTNINNLYWDYSGIYNVDDVPGNSYMKYLTLDYDFMGNEYFDLSVINDRKIELLHPASGTVYQFTGRGYIQYKNKRKLRESKAAIAKQMVKISNF